MGSWQSSLQYHPAPESPLAAVSCPPCWSGNVGLWPRPEEEVHSLRPAPAACQPHQNGGCLCHCCCCCCSHQCWSWTLVICQSPCPKQPPQWMQELYPMQAVCSAQSAAHHLLPLVLTAAAANGLVKDLGCRPLGWESCLPGRGWHCVQHAWQHSNASTSRLQSNIVQCNRPHITPWCITGSLK